jgi:hypothetical protein
VVLRAGRRAILLSALPASTGLHSYARHARYGGVLISEALRL